MPDPSPPTDERREPVEPVSPPPSRRSRASLLIWAGVIVLLIGGTAWFMQWRAREKSRATRPSQPTVSVVTAVAQQGDLPVTLNALGTVTPLATVTVKTQINGRLVSVGFQEGQLVKAGDFLAQIDPRPYQIALDQANAQLVRDSALLDGARVDLTRYRTLMAQDSIPRQQLDTQEYLVRQYEGTVKSDEAAVDNAQLNLEYCRILSPLSGRVGLRQVDPGNYIQTSDPGGLVIITQLQPISVIFTLPEDNVPAVVQRLAAGATLPVIAYDRTLATKLATGTLMTVDNQIDTTTGTVKLRAQFDNRDYRLFPNQFVSVVLQVNTLKDAHLVPTAAIQRGAPGTFVYVVNAERVVSLRPVTLGPTDGNRVAVQTGVKPGDQVVVDGADKLRDGAKVTLGREGASPGGALQQQAPGAPGTQQRSRKGDKS